MFMNIPKRKFTPFPSISSNINKVFDTSEVPTNFDISTTNTNNNINENDNKINDIYNVDYELNKIAIMNKTIIKNNDLKILVSYLPEKHEYSIRLTNELLSLQNKNLPFLPQGIDEVYIVSKGLIEVILNIGNPLGYGCRRWYCRIGGGSGMHYDINQHTIIATDIATIATTDIATAMATTNLVPVGIRFLQSSSFAHVMVDDTGCIDETFWHLPLLSSSYQTQHQQQPITLVNILQQLVDMLLQPLTILTMKDDTEIDNYHKKWNLAEQHTYHKVQNIQRYKELQLYSTLFTYFNEDLYLHPSFKLLINHFQSSLIDGTCRDKYAIWKEYIYQNSPGIYSFDLFSNDYCMKLIEEVDNYEVSNLIKRRPNTMNNYGLILNDIGMYDIMSKLMEQYIEPLVQILYEQEPVACGLDHHHTFIVQYDANNVKGDLGLDMHHDSSEITLNVCLGKEGFTGGKLKFCGEAGSMNYRKLQYQYQHVIGRAVIHLGRHRHGADDLIANVHNNTSTNNNNNNNNNNNSTNNNDNSSSTNIDNHSIDDRIKTSNQRINLIMWLRSSIFRSMAAYGVINADGYPKELETSNNNIPDLCCLSRFNDDDNDLQIQRYHKAIT